MQQVSADLSSGFFTVPEREKMNIPIMITSMTVLKHACTVYKLIVDNGKMPSKTDIDACKIGQPTVSNVPRSRWYGIL